jgi:cytochrome c peroxidase
MTIATGDRLPDATFLEMGPDGAAEVALADLTRGRKIILFGLPGAYTGTCSTQHVPSFIRTAEAFAAKGVDEIVCVSVNDPFVMQAWRAATGADKAGLRFLADADGSFARAIDMVLDVPALGFHGRSKRYAMLVEDGVVTVFHPEVGRGCEISGGESLLAAI